MKKRTIILTLLIIATLAFIFSRCGSNSQEPDDYDYPEEVEQAPEPETPVIPEEPEPEEEPTETTTSTQEKFQTHTDELKQVIDQCQKTVRRLIPDDFFDQEIPNITSVDQMIQTISEFYQVVNEKIHKANDVLQIITKEADHFSKPDEVFKSLSTLEECGEFEEEVLVEMVIQFIETEPLSEGDKQRLVEKLISSFQAQLRLNPSLYFSYSKVSALQLLFDTELIPPHLESELSHLSEISQDVEFNYRKSLPVDILERKSLSPHDIAFIRAAEQKEVKRLNETILQILSDIRY